MAEIDDATLALLQRAADKVEIIEVLSLYHHLVDGKDIDGLDRVFTPDARCEYRGQEELFGIPGDAPSGLDAIRTFLADALAPVDTRHNMTNHVFTAIDADSAHTRSYLVGRGGTEGVYEVDHVRTAAGWRMRQMILEQRFDPDTARDLIEQRRLMQSGATR